MVFGSGRKVGTWLSRSFDVQQVKERVKKQAEATMPRIFMTTAFYSTFSFRTFLKLCLSRIFLQGHSFKYLILFSPLLNPQYISSLYSPAIGHILLIMAHNINIVTSLRAKIFVIIWLGISTINAQWSPTFNTI